MSRKGQEKVKETILEILGDPHNYDLQPFGFYGLKKPENWVHITHLGQVLTSKLYPWRNSVATEATRRAVEALVRSGEVEACHGHGYVLVRLAQNSGEIHLNPNEKMTAIQEQRRWEMDHQRGIRP